MTPQDWDRIKGIFQDAIEQPREKRADWLAERCGGDGALQMEVESLLEAQADLGSFGAVPAVEALRGLGSGARDLGRSLQPGDRLGAYEVEKLVGVGGMGEVYQARDGRLGRAVAIKVLPASFALDRDRVARFEREARVLAALNNPHIATIYGVEDVDGGTVLVLELVGGETLAERIARGPIPIREAVAIATQICEALEAAHEKAIVHRDLKPANIKLTREGTAKVLDFGLARVDEHSAADLSQSPTLTIGATREGMLLGTAAYMSPEQVRGRATDKRTDVWSFGCVLYEALTGNRAFRCETASDCVAAILEHEPDWSALPEDIPEAIHRLLYRCLEKDPQRRIHDIADVRIEIEEAMARRSSPISRDRRPSRHIVLASIVGVIAGAVLTGVTFRVVAARSTTTGPAVTRSLISLQGTHFESLALSSDGRTLAFVGTRDGRSQLYVRPLDRSDAVALDGTTDAEYPFFSPDGQWIGFNATGQLKKIAVSGGAPQRLGSRHNGWFRGAAWLEDGTIVYARYSDLWRLSSDGDSEQLVAAPEGQRREKTIRWPDMLPDGDSVLLTVATADTDNWDEARIDLLSLRTGKRRVLIDGGTYARYVRSGYIVYARKGQLLTVPFALDRLQVLGPPVVVLENVFIDRGNGYGGFTIGSNGSAVFASSTEQTSRNQLWWVGRTGRAELAASIGRAAGPVSLSPDGRHAAVVADETHAVIWICDLAQNTVRRFVSDWDNLGAVWTPDSQRVTFSSNRDTGNDYFNLYSQDAEGGAPAERLTHAERGQIPIAWSPDGRTLLFGEASRTAGPFLMLYSRESGTVRRFVDRPTLWGPEAATISPDGQWVAHLVNDAGELGLHISKFPEGTPTWQVSNDGSVRPRWAPNGKELFYLHGNQMTVVEIATTPQFAVSKPRVLFDAISDAFDLSRDGERFLFVKRIDDRAVTEVNLAENWSQELTRRAGSR